MSENDDVITFKTFCRKCGREVRIYHDKEKQFPKCVYCGGDLIIPEFVEENITKKIEKYKGSSSLYEYEKKCPICDRLVSSSGMVGEERTCSYCTCNFKLITTGALVPVSFGMNQKNKTFEQMNSLNLTLEQGLQIIHQIEVLIEEYFNTEFADLIVLIRTASEKLITLNQFDVDFISLITQNLVPMFSQEISEEDDVYIFPIPASHAGELFGLIVGPSITPMLRTDSEGYNLITIPVQSATELRYISQDQISRVSARQESLLDKNQDKTFAGLIEGILFYNDNFTKAQFFIKIEDENDSESLRLSDDGKRYFQGLFMDFGLLFFLGKLLYGKWFPAFALRYLHIDALQRIYSRKIGVKIPDEILTKIDKVLSICQG